MKNSTIVALAAVLLFFGALLQFRERSVETTDAVSINNTLIEECFQKKLSNINVTGSGQVNKILKDDTEGSRHQRFIVAITKSHTVLIAHNIDIAPRVKDLGRGDQIIFSGVYEWNKQGGVIHWTHHDPAARHAGGWLRHKGNLYQ